MTCTCFLPPRKQATPVLSADAKDLTEKLQPLISLVTKKGCAISLGNHCMSELMDSAASRLDYLQSGHSPGKRGKRGMRRRRTTTTRRRRRGSNSPLQEDLILSKAWGHGFHLV
ncbi:uncharacterized protein LOC143286333 [Babylonia areolata]|uniref:uncharacterized protein LOC143286333 n=1 Tax=Babylonia areolata TaxID=304850 RepID=UPI003FD1DC50